MIACPNCAKDNQDHYKFCLACGAKLPAAGAPAAPPDVAPPPSQPSAPPVVSPPGPPPGPPPAAPGAAPPPPMHHSATATTATPPGQAPEAPEPVAPPAAPEAHAASSGTAPNGGPCPGCTFQNPPGFKFCGRCGATLDDGAGGANEAGPDMGTANTMFVADASAVQAAAAAHQAEMEAAAEAQPAPPAAAPPAAAPPAAPPAAVPPAAAPVSPEAPPPGSTPSAGPEPVTAPQKVVPAEAEPEPAPSTPQVDGPPAKLVMLGPDGQPVGERALAPNERLEIGRECGPPWDDDAYLDPHHARVTVTQEGLQIEDRGSLNGVFVKLNTRVEVQDGDQFRVGQELVQYEDLPEPTPTEDGTERMGSPNPGYWGRLSILVDPEGPSMAFPIEGDGIMIGREHGDITFPQDGYVSGKHCRVVGDDTGVYMEDLGSSNGTYMRVRSGVTLPFGSLVLIGQKLFQIERLD